MTLLLPAAPTRRSSRPAAVASSSPIRSRRWVLVLPLVLALIVRMAELVRPGQLFGVTGYDDGVYVGQTLRLLQGVLPYRHYVVVQPPGLMVLLAPFAAIVHPFGSDAVFATCRLLTVAVDVANVALIGAVLRHRSRRGQLLAMFGMAVYPAALASSSTVLLEPYLNLFCLLAVLAMFPGGKLAGRKRILLGGVLLGIAGAIKIFAVFPLIALAGIFAWRHRDRFLPLIAGAVAGFGVITAPFAALAPRAFFREAVLDQIIRTSDFRTPGWIRISDIDGQRLLRPDAAGPAVLLGVIALAVFVALPVIARRRRAERPDDLGRYLLASSAVVVLAFFYASTFYSHYAAFLGPFACLMLGYWAGALLPRAGILRPAMVMAAFLALAGASIIELGPLNATRSQEMSGELASVPKGSCVLAASPAYLLAADRFGPVRGCPDFVDTFGTTMVVSGGSTPPEVTQRNERPTVLYWERVLGRADYLVMSYDYDLNLPSTPEFRAWLRQHYRPVEQFPGHSGTLYERRGPK